MAVLIDGSLGVDKIKDGTIVDADVVSIAASKLTGALPAISAASLTSIPAANLTGALPAISGASLTNLPGGGKLLQVVSNTVLDYDTCNNPTSSPCGTPLTATLTPSATTSKIHISYSLPIMKNGFDGNVTVYIYRSINSGTWTKLITCNTTCDTNSSSWETVVQSDNYLDSPGVSGQTVAYKVYVAVSNTSYLCYVNSGGHSLTMTLMEIGA